MTVQCVTCERFTLRDCPLARHGFGLCALRPRHEAHSAVYLHDCRDHRPAPADRVAQRREWLAKKGAGS